MCQFMQRTLLVIINLIRKLPPGFQGRWPCECGSRPPLAEAVPAPGLLISFVCLCGSFFPLEKSSEECSSAAMATFNCRSQAGQEDAHLHGPSVDDANLRRLARGPRVKTHP